MNIHMFCKWKAYVYAANNTNKCGDHCEVFLFINFSKQTFLYSTSLCV